MTSEELDRLFTYHPPTQGQIPRYQAIRQAGRMFAQVLVNNVPVGADLSAAIRLIRQAVWTANAGIATHPRQIGEGRSKPGLVEAPEQLPEAS